MDIVSTIVIVAVALLAGAMIFRRQTVRVLSSVGGVLFLVLAALALSTLFAPGLYRDLAGRTVDAMGVRSQIQELDGRFLLNDLADASGRLLPESGGLPQDAGDVVDMALGLLGAGQAPDAPAQPERPPSRILEDNVLPGLISVVAVVLRIGTLLVSLSGMVAVVALSYASAVAREMSGAQAAHRELEARIAALEAALGGGTGVPTATTSPIRTAEG